MINYSSNAFLWYCIVSALPLLVTKLWLHVYTFQIHDLFHRLWKDSTNVYKCLVSDLYMPLIELSNLSSLYHFSFPSKQRRAGANYQQWLIHTLQPSLRLMSNNWKVWSGGINNLISKIIQWKPAPSTSQIQNTYLCAYGGLDSKGIKILSYSDFFWSHMTGDLNTVLWRVVYSLTMLMTEMGNFSFSQKEFLKGLQECQDKRRNMSFMSYCTSSLRFVPKGYIKYFLLFFFLRVIIILKIFERWWLCSHFWWAV